MRAALRAAAVVIAVISPNSRTSPWVSFESGGGWTAQAKVIPCCVAGVSPGDLRPPLSHLQAIDVTTPAGAMRLVEVVSDAAGLRRPPAWRAERIAQRVEQTVEVSERGSRDVFALLGDDARSEGVQLVFPQFEFSPAAQAALRGLGGDPLYDKPKQRETGRGTVVIQPVAANDLRALCSVADLLGGQRVPFQPLSDHEARARNGTFPLISFGMTSSDMTLMYFDLAVARGEKPLFAPSLVEGEAAIRLPNGVDYGYEADHHGIIARVTPHRNHEGRKWLFCAGLGPTGTEAAAIYLCDNWASLVTTADGRDFVTLVTCARGKPVGRALRRVRHDLR